MFSRCYSQARFFSAEFSTIATLPIRTLDERFSSLGASWVFSFQPARLPVTRPRSRIET